MTGKTRTIKTPLQRAEEALGVARRAEVKATEKHRVTSDAVVETGQALVAARQRLAYAGADPALPEQTRTDVAEYLAQVVGTDEEPDLPADGIEPILMAYSEWLDEKSPRGEDRHQHETLVADFLAAQREG